MVTPTGLEAYTALMRCIQVCPECGAPVLASFNAVRLDPVPVDASEPTSMTLAAARFPGEPVMLAMSPMPGQPAHRLHQHQAES